LRGGSLRPEGNQAHRKPELYMLISNSVALLYMQVFPKMEL